jgi:hypothetical protein
MIDVLCQASVSFVTLCKLRKESVQVVGKFLLVALTEGGRTAVGLDSTRTHRVEKIAHVEACPNVLGGEHLTARAECVTAFVDGLGRQRNVAGYDEITRIQSLDDFVVGDVEAARQCSMAGSRPRSVARRSDLSHGTGSP